MTSIFSGQLYYNLVKDQNSHRLENYDVNRFQRTVLQQANQGQREKELRESLEYQQAQMANLQTKLSELVEKLNNLYRRHMTNNIAFSKVTGTKYHGSTDNEIVQSLPRVDDTSYADTGGYPAGLAGILPHNDFDKIRNFPYNPYFGSKAIDDSDKNLIRTLWEQPNVTQEEAYRENGAFWSTISYLWGWDLDRINATYATKDITGREDVQINITALQPNKPQYPPLKAGDRFPINWTGGTGGATAPYPAVNIGGIRPGGVDYSHATDSINTGGDSTTYVANIIGPPSGNGAGTPPSGGNPFFVDNGSFLSPGDSITIVKTGGGNPSQIIEDVVPLVPGDPLYDIAFPNRAKIYTQGPAYGSPVSSGTISKTVPSSTAYLNVTGQDSINFGWEFDDLPLSLEVLKVDTKPDGTTIPTEYRVVYDIPENHPHFNALKALNGTEPKVIDAPTALQKDRIANEGFDYSGYTYIPGVISAATTYAQDGIHQTAGVPWKDNTLENEYPPPKLYGGAVITGASYGAIGGTGTGGVPGDPIVLSNPADYAPFGPGTPLALSGNAGATYPISTTVNELRYNQSFTLPDTGTGLSPSNVTSSLDARTFDVNDLVTFGSTGPNQVYRVISASNTTGFIVVPIDFDGVGGTYTLGPSNPVPANTAGIAINLWRDNLGVLAPKYGPTSPFGMPGIVTTASAPFSVNRVKLPDNAPSTDPILTFTLPACTDLTINSSTRVSMKYRFTLHQNYKRFASPGDDGELIQPPYANWTNFDWSSSQGPFQGSSVPHNAFAYPLASEPFVYIANEPMGAGPVTLKTIGVDSNPGSNSGWFDGFESISTDIVQGSNPNEAVIRVFFSGDLNGFQMEVADVQLVTYDGNLGSWDQGKYNSGNLDPLIQEGDLPIGQINSPNEVVNKYIPGLYQFTQFNDQYTNIATTADRNDIVRSPWEFAEMHFGDDATRNSSLSGELFMDLNGRRLNFDLDTMESTATSWGTIGTASANTPGTYRDTITAITDFQLTANANQAHSFVDPIHPGDTCIVADPEGDSEAYQYSESDPLTNGPRNDLVEDEILSGEAPFTPVVAALDGGRSVNPGTNTPTYYAANASPAPVFNPNTGIDFATGINTDTTGTVDRIAASVKSADNALNYTISIPTTDVNVLRKENNLLLNLGSIEQRDWSLAVGNLDMFVRTVPSYTTVPRYRVDSGGNIFDNFGKGYYNNSAGDVASKDRVYLNSNGATGNGQVSNFNGGAVGGGYENNPTAYATGGSYEDMINTHDRLSLDGDDYNLFDYVPDLTIDPASKEGARFGESYVGSLPTNFYWYRETLDMSVGETGVSPTGTHTPVGGTGVAVLNQDLKPAINFDGYRSNMNGIYNQEHSYVHNAQMPAFTNVVLGVAEQKDAMTSVEKTTSFAVWKDFPGINGKPSHAIAYSNAVNVNDPINAVGNNDLIAEMDFPASSITLQMQGPVNQAGYLIINEMTPTGVEAHAVPLPLVERTGPFPSYDDTMLAPTSFSFNAYGNSSVTRTGSKFMNFADVMDAADGIVDGIRSISVMTTDAGGEFAIGDPLGDPTNWPNGVLLHVDDASKFNMEYPKNTVTLGTSAARHRIMYRNTDTEPQTIYVVREDGTPMVNTIPGVTTVNGLVHADLQVTEITGTYTVSVVDDAGAPSVDGTKVKIDYVDNGTQREGKLTSAALSPIMDRVGRLAGDDPRTPGIETNAIAPRVFADRKGYVEPDAQVDVRLVAQDNDGNQKPRKLRSVQVEVRNGEQIVPSSLVQVYNTAGPFAPNADWPIAIFDGDVQINPEVTPDLNFLVGYYQGITAGSTDTVLNVTSAAGFKVGQLVTVNGEQREVQSILGNQVTLNRALSNPPKLGDRLAIGNDQGHHDLSLFLNRSLAMSAGAGLKVTLQYDEYDVTGYPPMVDLTSARPVTEVVGFSDPTPRSELDILVSNTGTGAPGNGIQVSGAIADYSVGQLINVNNQTRLISGITGSTIELASPANIAIPMPFVPAPQGGTISHIDFENHLVVGDGRAGGSSDNEFTRELKRIIDNPEYKELFRMNLFRNVIITASITDPYNDLISSKLLLDWDRERRQAEIRQTAFSAYFKANAGS